MVERGVERSERGERGWDQSLLTDKHVVGHTHRVADEM